MARIAIIGTGHVGLTTGACFAHIGHDVTCVDIDEKKIAVLRQGRIPIHEAGLEQIVKDEIESGRLRFEIDASTVVESCEFVYLCVPTPQGPDGSSDMFFIETAARWISPFLRRGSIVVNKSTVSVGSTRLIEQALGRPDVHVVSNPEFLREGSAVGDFMNPDRVVIGADDQAAATRVASLFLGVRAPIMITDTVSAETIKYASNAFLATKISFANAVAAVCEVVGADVNEVLRGMGYDRRIGHEFLKPGPGWGGSCFPKDTRAMIRIAEDAGYDFAFLRGVIRVNDEQFERVTDKIVRAAGGSVKGKKIGALGLTFKAGTDDLRESPAIEIISRLLDRGANVTAYDPTVSESPLPGLAIEQDAYLACEDASVAVVLTEWDEFKWLDPDKLAASMSERNVIDARNILDKGALLRRGFTYSGVGRS